MNCEDFERVLGMLNVTLNVASTCFLAWLGMKMQDAKHRREVQFRQLEYELQENRKAIKEVAENGASQRGPQP